MFLVTATVSLVWTSLNSSTFNLTWLKDFWTVMRSFIVFHLKNNTTPRLSNHCGEPFFSLIVLSPFTVHFLLQCLGCVPEIGRWVISGHRNHSAAPAGPNQAFFPNQIINPKISVKWNNEHFLLLMRNILFPTVDHLCAGSRFGFRHCNAELGL